jgi:hypothetical protein
MIRSSKMAFIISLLAVVGQVIGTVIGLLFLGAFLSAYGQEEAKIKEDMETWSCQRLHAYAGVDTHPKDLRAHAYRLAKAKRYAELSND